MQAQQTNAGIVAGVIRAANPLFIIVSICVPAGALIYALNFGPLVFLNYVHIMTGGLWTGIDVFLGFVLAPILGSMEPRERVVIFRRLMPRMAFLMPTLATVTIMAGFEVTSRLGFHFSDPRIIMALVLTGILTIQGFGLFLPNEIRIFQQLLSDKPDTDKIARLGMFNAKLGGLQAVFQVAMIFVMATIRL